MSDSERIMEKRPLPFIPFKKVEETRNDIGEHFNKIMSGVTVFNSTTDAMVYCLSKLDEVLNDAVLVLDVESGEWRDVGKDE